MSSESGSRARALRSEASAPSRSPSVCSATPSCMWARAIAAFRRIDARRCSTARERVAALAEHDAEVVLRFGMPGIELHGALQRGERAVEIARPPQRGAEMIVRVEELRRHGRRLAEAGDGVGRPSELAEREAEPVAGAGHVRRLLEGRFERGCGAGPILLPLELDAAGEEPRGVRGAGVRLRLSPSTLPGTQRPAQASSKDRERRDSCRRGEIENVHPWTTDVAMISFRRANVTTTGRGCSAPHRRGARVASICRRARFAGDAPRATARHVSSKRSMRASL